MNDSRHVRVAPAVAAAVGAIGISTVLYTAKLATSSSLPWLTAPLLTLLIYSGCLMIWGKLESIKQWLIGLSVMLGVHASLAVLMGIVFFFAEPSVGQVNSLKWSVLSYGPAIALELITTVAICYWIPKLLSAASTSETEEVVHHYEKRHYTSTIEAARNYRENKIERISTESRAAAEEIAEEQVSVPEPEEAAKEELLTSEPSSSEPEFSVESGGRKFKLVNGKLVEDDGEPETLQTQDAVIEVEEISVQVEKEIPWDAPMVPGEPDIRLSAGPVLARIPQGCLSIPSAGPELWLQFPQRWITPQLAEGVVKVRADKVLEQLPNEWLNKPVEEITASIEGGYLELPLKDIVDQMPWSVFALPNQRPAPELPGREWGALFREAA